MKKRLMRNEYDKKIAGVCSGVADYLDMDPSLVRVIWGCLFFIWGVGLIPYLICWAVLPVNDGQDHSY